MMTDRLQVKDHLRNSALYMPQAEPSLGGGWNRRLLYRRMSGRQLAAFLRENRSPSRPFFRMGIPLLGVVFALVCYFDYIHPERWYAYMAPVLNFEMPPIGLREVLLFLAAVNGLAFFIRKRPFAL